MPDYSDTATGQRQRMQMIDRRTLRSQRVLAHVMHIIGPHLKSDANSEVRNVARELGDFFHSQGVDVITEADRIRAGLQPRDHNGLTMEELVIIEGRLLATMLAPNPVVFPVDPRLTVECRDERCPMHGRTMVMADGSIP